MKRLAGPVALALWVGTLVVGTGCDRDATSEEPSSSSGARVNAVTRKEDDGPSLDAFCDVYRGADEAAGFEFPEVEPEQPTEAKGWRWVNLWATWCEPCKEEMPLMTEWVEDLEGQGLSDLKLVAIGDTREQIEKFRKKQPDAPESLRMADPGKMKDWIASLGLDRGAPLPIHIFVSPEGKARCLRAAGIEEDDFAAVEKLLE